jgi:IS30 family transposase
LPSCSIETIHRSNIFSRRQAAYDPKNPWQRGSNENTNALLRQYFPKGLDLSGYSQGQLDAVANRLNGRPRKTLDYETPAQRFERCVALTD